jgi:primosomal protein N'
VLGPAPAAIAKLRDKHRFNLQLQSADGVALRAAVKQILDRSEPPEGVDWMADVDPQSML